jgi:hypothetical protein
MFHFRQVLVLDFSNLPVEYRRFSDLTFALNPIRRQRARDRRLDAVRTRRVPLQRGRDLRFRSHDAGIPEVYVVGGGSDSSLDRPKARLDGSSDRNASSIAPEWQ